MAVVALTGLRSAAVAHATGEPLTIGVGNLTSAFDKTSESFSLYRYLETHPVKLGAAALKPKLVDHPMDAPYAVSGKVTGSIEYKEGFYVHQQKVELKVWAQGTKVTTLSASCAGSTPVQPTIPPDFRYDALAGCFDKLLPLVSTALAKASAEEPRQ